MTFRAKSAAGAIESYTALESTLRYVSGTTVGNLLAFSYVIQRFIDDRSALPELHELWNQMREGDNPLWKCGLRPERMATTFVVFSLYVRKDTGPSDHLASYPVTQGAVIGRERNRANHPGRGEKVTDVWLNA